MTTIKCRKCSAHFPSSDRVCPSCGSRAMSVPAKWLGLGLLGVSLIGGSALLANRGKEQVTGPSEARIMGTAFSVVRASLKDPGSAQFGPAKRYVAANQQSVVCGTVNAKNSFGGYIGVKRFVYSYESNSLAFEDSPDFPSLWGSLCRS